MLERKKKKPLEVLTGLFSRSGVKKDTEEEEYTDLHSALHSPYHARNIDKDMEHLRLSRQDNPYLKALSTSELHALHRSTNKTKELHARLVRSPPPVLWTRHSEPNFNKLNLDSVFSFPPVDKDMEQVAGKFNLSPEGKGGRGRGQRRLN